MGSVNENFILNAKIALQIQKTRIAITTRIYSHLTESFVRGNKNYAKLLTMRKNKNADRKATAVYTKKLLAEQLKINELETEDFNKLFEEGKAGNTALKHLVKAEDIAFKEMQPLLEQMPLYAWMQTVKGLGLNFSVKLFCHLRDLKRFPHPSAVRKYCGTAPMMKRVRGEEANFNPELKGVLLGQIAKNFLMNRSQYKAVYDTKKKYYTELHATDLANTLQKKEAKQKITKDDWTPLKIHNFAIKAMINRFIVELWQAAYLVEGLEPPRNPYILNDPNHTVEPMIVPVSQEILEKLRAKLKLKPKG